MTATVTRIAPDYEPSHDGGVSSVDLIQRAGITYRQLDYWTRTDRLRAVRRKDRHGSGYERTYPPTEVAVACLMGRLVASGMTPALAHDCARDLAETGTTQIAGITVHLPTDL